MPKAQESIMGQQKQRNRRWVLASRPHGAPVPENFRLEEDDVATPGEGQVLLRTVYLSLDPYMRGRMSDEPSYSPPVDIGGVMVGGTVSRVVESNHPDYQPGDWVLGYSGWQDYDISSGDDLVKLGDHPQNPSWSLGVLGMPGFTAYMGLLDIGQPKEGETLVVAAATGPVGATVGQIGKLKGCRVVGVAGGAEKCRHAIEVLGFDVCLDHHADDFAEQLVKACPKGIDKFAMSEFERSWTLKPFITKPENPIIGNDVWIGNDVVLKGGIAIGDGAVIAANSVEFFIVPLLNISI
jgi:NADPH-dependent curcumin reductase